MTRSKLQDQTGPILPYPIPAAQGYHEFMPGQQQPIGSLLPADKFPQNEDPPKLFEPITIRGVTFPNRAWVSPMCMCEQADFFCG